MHGARGGCEHLEGLAGADATEGFGTLGADAPELLLVGEPGGEGRDGHRVVALREGMRREPASACRLRIGELVAQHVRRRLHRHVAEDPHVGIDDHEARSHRARDGEAVAAGLQLHALGARRASDVTVAAGDGEAERDLEHRGHAVRRALHLLHGAREDAVVPRHVDLDLRMTGPHHHLVERASEAATGDLLEGTQQIARLDDAPRVAIEVRGDALPEERVAELGTEDVQHEAALLVEMAIEEIERRVVVLAHDRAAIAPVRLGQVRREVVFYAVFVLVTAERLLAPHVLHERGEALVEPALRPVAARHVVAEPLVRELVGDEVVARHVDGSARVEQDVLVHRGGGGVLHAAEDEVAHHDLRVLVPRIRHAGELGEERHHVRRAAERSAPVLLAALRHEIGERHLATHVGARCGREGHAVAEDRELAGHDGDEVARVRVVHPPVEGLGAGLRVLCLAGQLAVREHGKTGGNGDAGLGRHLDVRLVVARKDVTRVLFLALRPGLARSRRDVLVGLEEVEAPARRRLVANDQLAVLERPRHVDHEQPPVIGVLYILIVDGDRADGERDGVQLDGRSVGVDAAQGQRCGPADAALREVEHEVERDVLDGERSIALEVAWARREGEGSAGAARAAPLVRLFVAGALGAAAASVIVTETNGHRSRPFYTAAVMTSGLYVVALGDGGDVTAATARRRSSRSKGFSMQGWVVVAKNSRARGVNAPPVMKIIRRASSGAFAASVP